MCTTARARQFRWWLRRLRRQIRRAPGFLDYRVHPPTCNDNECVITYRFADPASLDRWLVSPQRLPLIEESGALLTAPPVEQRVVEPRRDGVTLVSSVRVRPGADDAYQALHGQGVAAAQKLGGLLRSELIPPIPDRPADAVLGAVEDDLARPDRANGAERSGYRAARAAGSRHRIRLPVQSPRDRWRR